MKLQCRNKNKSCVAPLKMTKWTPPPAKCGKILALAGKIFYQPRWRLVRASHLEHLWIKIVKYDHIYSKINGEAVLKSKTFCFIAGELMTQSKNYESYIAQYPPFPSPLRCNTAWMGSILRWRNKSKIQF
jgi:hypothetical protein